MPEEKANDDENKNNQESEREDEFDPTHLDIRTKNSRNKALLEFRYRVEQAIINDYLLTKKNKRNSPKANEKSKEITLWGVPLLPSASHEGTNTVLQKFLKAKNYKVHEAFVLLRKTLKWRAEFRADGIVEDFVSQAGNSWFSDGKDKEGRPLCYSVLGEKCEIPINEAEVTVTWDVTVVGYEVTYKEEFIPEDDCSYNILLQKEKRMEKSIRHSFPIREPGKIVITVVNGSFKSKNVFYRYKSRPSVPLYMFIKQ